jgi:hypothetical protein
LPQNIAVRHRICTDIAKRIKDLGYPGDCGYNQLLYPVEHQTRDLMKFIVDKLPRSAEEGTEGELVGANAILNRNITQALSKWQKTLWQLPSCQSGKPLTNIYKRIPFSLQDSNFLATKLLNKHSLEKVIEQRKAEQLNRRFNSTNAAAGSAVPGSSSSSSAGNSLLPEDNNALMDRIIASLREVESNTKATHKKAGGAGAGGEKEGGVAVEAGDADEGKGSDESNNNSKSKTGAQMALSFQELVQQITDTSNHGKGTD